MAQITTISPKIFLLPEALWIQIRNHLQSKLPEEACGLIAGRCEIESSRWIARHVYPVENILHSPVRYLMEARSQLAAFEQIDQAGLELIAIFHSHPNGPAFPSEMDRKETYYQDAIQLICFLQDNGWNCRAYKLGGNQFFEIELVIT